MKRVEKGIDQESIGSASLIYTKTTTRGEVFTPTVGRGALLP